MQSEYLVRAEVVKISTMASKGGVLRMTLEMPLIDKTATLAMAQSATCAVKLNFDKASIDEAAGQLGLFDEKEREDESGGGDKKFFGAE